MSVLNVLTVLGHDAPIRSRLYPGTDSGTIAEMDARSEPFEAAIDNAVRSLPAGLRAAMSNVEIVIEATPIREFFSWPGKRNYEGFPPRLIGVTDCCCR